jgi:hypothetical protein
MDHSSAVVFGICLSLVDRPQENEWSCPRVQVLLQCRLRTQIGTSDAWSKGAKAFLPNAPFSTSFQRSSRSASRLQSDADRANYCQCDRLRRGSGGSKSRIHWNWYTRDPRPLKELLVK